MSRRVVVTGVGLVSSLGIGTEESWGAARQGVSGIGPITQFDATEFACRIAGEVKGFDPAQYIEKKEIALLKENSLVLVNFLSCCVSYNVCEEIFDSLNVNAHFCYCGFILVLVTTAYLHRIRQNSLQ